MIINPYSFLGAPAFNPLDLSPSLWLDASDASTIYDATSGGSLVAANGAVARWEDKSGNARHATQSTSGDRPARKTNIQNGKDVLRFDGASDYLVGTLTQDKPVTVFIVVAASDVNADSYVFTFNGSSAIISGYTNGKIEYYDLPRLDAGTTSANVFALYEVIYPGSGTVETWKNATSVATGSVGTFFASTSYYVCQADIAAAYFPGDVAEILVFPSALSSTDRQSVESYLNSKWDLY